MTERNAPITPVRYVPPGGEPSARARRLRPAAAAVAVAVAASLLAAWFLLTARAVYFEVDPPFADVAVDTLLQLNLGGRYLLRPGDYALRIEAPGFRSRIEALHVGEAASQEFAFTLDRLPGHLRVETVPLVPARVSVDGDFRGEAPLLIAAVPAGPHRLTVEAERYLPHEQIVEVEGLDRQQELNIALQPAWADLTFASEPAGAAVFVDDEQVGNTPLTVEVLAGVRALRVKHSGFKDWQDEVEVRAGAPLEFSAIRLVPADARVQLASEPPRASVTVDGEYRGLTPLELALTPGREATIRLFRQGYQPASRSVAVASGDEQRLHVTLQPELVAVTFEVDPADAEIRVDGRLIGSERDRLQLPSRPHRIEIRRDGYVDYATTLTPHPGMAQQLKVRLKSREQARLEQIKPQIRTHAGQTLKLFHPGPFTMGASRREPGRRANETLRQVRLERPFYLGLHEVTNEEFRQFDPDHVSGTAFGRSLNSARQPVARVAWEQAARYCNWLSGQDGLTPFYVDTGSAIAGVNPLASGYRLPTEAEWEWAARTVDGGGLLKFPWGEAMPPPANSGNYADSSTAGMLADSIARYEDGHLVAAPVGSFAPGNRGLFDIGGNVAEWVHDFYDAAISMAGSAEVDPLGPPEGEFHVIKGSSWAHGTVTELRLSYRDYAAEPREDVGFRLARYLD